MKVEISNMLHYINTLLRSLNLKVIRTSEEFNWMGNTYYLPMKLGVGYNGGIVLKDYFNKELPIVFKYEEEARFFLNVLDVAINPYKGY
jgi:hypothetical protein